MTEASFYDNVTPALTAGDYQLIVQDTVTVDGAAQPPYAMMQRFRVTGPRAGLSAGDVVAVSPPAGSQGAYGDWLPHVVLAQRSLPWQVAIADDEAAAGPAPPWVALLLLTSQEIDVAGAPPGAGSTGTQSVPLAEFLTPPSGTLGPAMTAGQANLQSEQPGISCSVVDVSYAAFRAVVPQLGELRYLAHVRQVDAGDQEALAVPAPGWYSVVAGNRLPGVADGGYIAHLVSLEGFAGDLPDQPARTGYSLVRLISLASWTFTSSTGTGDFATLAEKLRLAAFTVPVPVTGTDAASQLVSGALADGYTLLGYTTRLGEQTAAWYRGPYVAAQVTANPQPPFPTAAAALCYDQATGMFDVSYAAAWEIGRLLTLANGPVAQSLATWTGAAVTANRLLLERSASAPGGAAPQASLLAAGARQRAARRLIVEHVVPALLGKGGARSALGLPADPTGLRGRGLPGVLDAETLHRIAATDDPYGQLLEQVLTAANAPRAGNATTPGPADARAAGGDAGNGQSDNGGPAGNLAPHHPGPADAPVPRHEALRRLAADPAAQAVVRVAAGPVPADVSAWLAGLQQLTGVPFGYLVPDARTLLAESIRFFAVDPNWTAALVDGALSLAATAAPSAAASAALRPAVAAVTGSAPSYSGFLLRSALVSGWPGLSVRGYADPQGTTATLPLARLERLAPTVLLALFTGVIQRVELVEPTQHLHFGVIPPTTAGGAPTLMLRWIDAAKAAAETGSPVTAALRQDPARSVLDMTGTVSAITTGLTQAYGTQAVPPLGPAAVSLQFAQSTVVQAFTTAVTATP